MVVVPFGDKVESGAKLKQFLLTLFRAIPNVTVVITMFVFRFVIISQSVSTLVRS